MNGLVNTEVKDGVGFITLNRPGALNAIHIPLALELLAAIGQLSNDSLVRCVLVRGMGKHFCAGGDVKWFEALGDRLSEGLDEILAILNPFMLQLFNLRVPIVTAVQGHTAGAGVGLALAGDIVLAGESFKLLSSYSAIGLSPDVGAVYSLTRRIGPSRTKEFFFSDKPLNVTKCLDWGIVNSVYPDEKLHLEAERYAIKLAQAPTHALKLTKRLIDQACNRNIEDHLALEREFMARCGRSYDGQEGVRAFLEKRKPNFRGE